MKKLFLAILLFVTLAVPSFGHAQTLSPEEMRSLLVQLMNQLITLQQQLLSLQKAPEATKVVMTTPSSNNQVVIIQNNNQEPTVSVEPITVSASVLPSCELKIANNLPGQDDPRTARYTWTSNQLEGVTGQIFYGTNFGIGNGETEFRWVPIGQQITKPNGDMILSFQSIPGAAPTFNQDAKFKLELGDATCTFDFVK